MTLPNNFKFVCANVGDKTIYKATVEGKQCKVVWEWKSGGSADTVYRTCEVEKYIQNGDWLIVNNIGEDGIPQTLLDKIFTFSEHGTVTVRNGIVEVKHKAFEWSVYLESTKKLGQVFDLLGQLAEALEEDDE